MVEQNNSEKLELPGELNEHQGCLTPEGIEGLFEENNIEYTNLSHYPECVFLSPYINILKRKGVIDKEPTDTSPKFFISDGKDTSKLASFLAGVIKGNYLRIYLLTHENKKDDPVLFFINWQARRNLTVTYTVGLEEAADFCERYWDNERALFKKRQRK